MTFEEILTGVGGRYTGLLIWETGTGSCYFIGVPLRKMVGIILNLKESESSATAGRRSAGLRSKGGVYFSNCSRVLVFGINDA